MKRHELDIVSLVSGLLFGSLGVAFALHALGTYSLDVRVVPAIVLIVLGIAGIAAALVSTARASDDRRLADEPQRSAETGADEGLAEERGPVPGGSPEP
jgi:hypothetical protein